MIPELPTFGDKIIEDGKASLDFHLFMEELYRQQFEIGGEWLPEIVGATSAGTATYPIQNGNYQIWGRFCFIRGHVSWNSHTGTGAMQATLPIKSSADSDSYSTIYVRPSDVALTSGYVMVGLAWTDSTELRLQEIPTGGGTVGNVTMDAAGSIIFTGFYLIDR